MKRLILTATTILFSALTLWAQSEAATAPTLVQSQPAAKHAHHHHSKHHTHHHHPHHTGA
jgi:hypothetical protein